MIYTSPFGDLNVPTDLSLSQFIARNNPDDVSSDRVIASDFDNPGRSLTFGELRKRAAQGAASLRYAFGMGEGDVVCIYGQNSVNWLLLCHCVMWGGGCFCALNPLATPYELQHYFEIAQPTIIAVDGGMVQRVKQALKAVKLSRTPRIVVIEGSDHQQHTTLPKFPKDFIRFQVRSVAPFDLSKRDNRKVAVGMCFSSGTSGRPKAVVLSHYNLIAYLLSIRITNPFIHSAHMREVFFPPFAHIYGLVSAVLLSSYCGSYIVAMKNFDFLAYLKRCADIRATVLRLVPALAVRMTKDPEVLKLDLKSVHTLAVSGASLSTETVKDLQKILHPSASVLNGYGMTEGSISMLRETQSHRAGSLGKPVAGVSIRVVDDNFNDVPEGQDGECLFKGPTVFLEYRGNPEETSNTFKDGWLRTGDIVRVDEDGYFWMTGRKKELIKYKGNQVPPAELESVLLSHPHVDEAGVVGVYDEKQETELPVGAVVLGPAVKEEHIHNTLADIMRHVDERVAPYKRLRGGLFHLPALPKGSTGKLVRREIPAKLAEHAKKQTSQPKL